MSPVDNNGNIKTGSTHYEFMEEMAKKTVINRACKPIINSSSDAYLYQSVQRQEMIEAEVEANAQLPEPEEMEVIDVQVDAQEATTGDTQQEMSDAPPALEQEPERHTVEAPSATEAELEPAF